jgi:hypothetical protein
MGLQIMYNTRLEKPLVKVVQIPAFLDSPHKNAVFYVDLVKSGGVHVVSEFRGSDGKCYRLSAWLGEGDSMGWTDTDKESNSEQEDD